MSTHKHFDKICCVILAFTLLLTVLFINAEKFGIQKTSAVPGYENKLFDTSKVHTVDIITDDSFLQNCKNEEYYSCSVVIDNEAYKNVAIRAKGNTSITQVEAYGNNRYSFKIEFDHYDSSKTYYGLDKLCLNNIIQDNTYMKDYLTYRMMAETGAAAPLCSYVNITINGENRGLYLAVEGIEDAFLLRNYGKDHGELYKPDSADLGGSFGNGEKININGFTGNTIPGNTADESIPSEENPQSRQMPNDNPPGNFNEGPEISANNNTEDRQTPEDTAGEPPQNLPNGAPPFDNREVPGAMFDGTPPFGDSNQPTDGVNSANSEFLKPQAPNGMQNGGMNSDDVLLKYIDDDPDSYSNIFNNAKTDITYSDKQRLIKALKQLSDSENPNTAVDIDAVIRYFVIHNFVLNFDSYTGSIIHNYYLYEKDGQMQMLPWDYNLAFGGFQSNKSATELVNYPIDSPVSDGNTEDRPMLALILKNEEYTALYHSYFSEFIAEWFENGYFEEITEEIFALISPYVEQDPTKFCTFDEFKTGVSTLKEFCALRAESIGKQLDGTIASTAEKQENSTLINADKIQISAMGSMVNPNGAADIFKNDIKEPPSNANTNGDTASAAEKAEKAPDASKADKLNSFNSDSAPSAPNSIPENFDSGQLTNVTPPKAENTETATEQNASGKQTQKNSFNDRPNISEQTQLQTDNILPTDSLLLISISITVLVLGLIFAKVFKRRK